MKRSAVLPGPHQRERPMYNRKCPVAVGAKETAPGSISKLDGTLPGGICEEMQDETVGVDHPKASATDAFSKEHLSVVPESIQLWSRKKSSDEQSESSGSKLYDSRGKSWLPCIDYVLVYDAEEYSSAPSRVLYEKELRQTGLLLHTEKIGTNCFVKIYCPFDRLCFEAEQVKLEMPLKDCDIAEPEPTCFSAFLKKYFETDDEVDYVSGPFDRNKLQLFDGCENEATFFRSSLRSLLVYHMLINLQHDEAHCPFLTADYQDGSPRRRDLVSGSSSRKHGLPYLLMKGVYKDAFIIHEPSCADPSIAKERDPDKYRALIEKIGRRDDPRSVLNKTWTKWTKFQPLWKIRNYLGEKIALYFAWQGLFLSFLWLPAVLGLCIFFYGIFLSVQSAQFQDCKCLLNGTSETENKKEHCMKKTLVDALSVDLLGVVKTAFNNELNPWFSLFICLWGTAFIQMWRRKSWTLSYEWDSNNYQASEPDRPEFVGTQLILDPVSKEMIWVYPSHQRIRKFFCSLLVIAGMMSLVFLTIAGSITFKVFMRTYYKCPSEDTDLTTLPVCKPGEVDHPVMCLITGTILPGLMMALSVMFWGYVYENIAFRITQWENHQTQSDFENALILKVFGFQFVNNYSILFYLAIFRPEHHDLQQDGIFGMGDKYRDTCPRGSCMSTLAFQVLLLMVAKPVVKSFNDLAVPWVFKHLKRAFELMKLKNASKKIAHIQEKVEAEIGTDDSHVPISGNTYLEKEWRKPDVTNFALEEFTEKVIQFGYVVMFAAAFPLAPFIALLVNLADLRVDARRLLWFNQRPVAFIASDIGMWEPILSFLNFCGVVSNGFLVASTSSYADQNEMDTSARLFTMIAFEHMLFVMMYLLKVVIPNTPRHVKLAIRREKYQVAKVLEEGYIPQTTSLGSSRSRLSTAATKRLGLRPRRLSSQPLVNNGDTTINVENTNRNEILGDDTSKKSGSS